jgi:hypothetical protein
VTGLVDRVTQAVLLIDAGRKGFAIKGKADEARSFYEEGISEAMSVFQEAQKLADPYSIILIESAFITQEFQLCDKSDSDTINSLTKAIADFDDAFLVLTIVDDKNLYLGAEKSHPHKGKYRVKGFPKDSFHLACNSHDTRLRNILRAPGIDPIEKALLKQRLANLTTAQNSYIEKQKKALDNIK